MLIKNLSALWLVLAMSLGCQNQDEALQVGAVESGNMSRKSLGDSSLVSTQKTTLTDQVVEASCGECQFGMQGNGCDLAIRIDGKSFFVDGSSIDDHGDAHGDNGLCNCIRKALVTGEINKGRFVAASFAILPREK